MLLPCKIFAVVNVVLARCSCDFPSASGETCFDVDCFVSELDLKHVSWAMKLVFSVCKLERRGLVCAL